MLRGLILILALIMASAAFAGPVGKPAPKFTIVGYDGAEALRRT